MPSPRSVLHDIAEQGLKPHHAHSRINGAGNLKAASLPDEPVAEPVAEVADEPVKKKAEKKKPEPKPGLVKLHCDDCSKENDCGCACDKCQPKSVKKDD